MESLKLLESKTNTLSILLRDLVSKHGEAFSKCAEVVSKALAQDSTIFWCGNGGSAAESSHLAV